MFLNKIQSTVEKMNLLGEAKQAFLFILDFKCDKPLIIPLENINGDEILYSLNDNYNYEKPLLSDTPLEFDLETVTKKKYTKAFNLVQKHIHHGDSFLLNLTMPSKIRSNYSLKDIFFASKAKYKLWLKDNFVVFSPEIFIQTKNNHISSFPMKGTIDASIPDAKNKLLSSEKELAEHYTIVDLIRNDLSIVSKNVKVEQFRYIDKINTNRGELLQMSSKITGELNNGWQSNIGNLIVSLLPAGSISGAPKKKTLEIIQEAEAYERAYYTGVFGIFDGQDIDSGVMIRYVEKTNEGLVYKSGGGITAKSNLEEEYQELIQKVYIPIN
ncbi:MAG: aminodeoxychorismate synthase component I [Marinilabiliales bacterium]|nr:MAG: aminodeoxychorismate synthase component I [Marinilabiliales bacterium]